MPWTITEHSTNVHTIGFTYSSYSLDQRVLLMSDQHIDNALCRLDLLTKHLDQAKELNAPIVSIGDLFCVMGGPGDRRGTKKALREEHTKDDYFNAIIDDTYEKLKGYPFAVLGYGNHETSVIKHHGIDLLKILANKLGCYTGGYRGYVKFKFEYDSGKSKGNRQTIKMYYDHGSGGAAPVTKGTIKSARRADMVADADIIASGHIHESWVLERLKFIERSGKVLHKTVYHVQCPTYKDEIGSGVGGWAIEKGMAPKPLGAWWLRFRMDGNRIKMTLERAD